MRLDGRGLPPWKKRCIVTPIDEADLGPPAFDCPLSLNIRIKDMHPIFPSPYSLSNHRLAWMVCLTAQLTFFTGCVAVDHSPTHKVELSLSFGEVSHTENEPEFIVFRERRVLARNIERITSSNQLAANIAAYKSSQFKCVTDALNSLETEMPLVPLSKRAKEEEERVTIFRSGYVATTIYVNGPVEHGKGLFHPAIMTTKTNVRPGNYDSAEPLGGVVIAKDIVRSPVKIKSLDAHYREYPYCSTLYDQMFALSEAIDSGRLAKANNAIRTQLLQAIQLQFEKELAVAKVSPSTADDWKSVEKWLSTPYRTIESWAKPKR